MGERPRAANEGRVAACRRGMWMDTMPHTTRRERKKAKSEITADPVEKLCGTN